jgi:predicted transcriptional regulator
MKIKKDNRNLMIFEAPLELTDKAKLVAEKTMISKSALCRQAISQYIHRYEADTQAKEYALY